MKRPPHEDPRGDWVETQAGSDLQADLRCAVTSRAPVLITGPADLAYDLALRIHRSGSTRDGQFIALDCASAAGTRDLDRTFRDIAVRATVFLQSVDRLGAAVQPVLAAHLATSRARVIAATSARLIDCVAAGTFDELLFYRLNQIHLVTHPPAGPATPRA